MSIFQSILNKIFRHGTAGTAQAATPPAQPVGQAQPAKPTVTMPAQPVDVDEVLSKLAATKGGGGNYKSSIVDLLKMLDLDSSLAARKELAKELSYSGDTGDSAAMNIWLHAQVMQKVAEHRGKLDQDLNARA